MPWSLSTVRSFFKLASGWVEKIAHLERRVTAIEDQLGKIPADACPFCGERTMRMKSTHGPLGSIGNQYQQECWKCSSCNQQEPRIKRF